MRCENNAFFISETTEFISKKFTVQRSLELIEI